MSSQTRCLLTLVAALVAAGGCAAPGGGAAGGAAAGVPAPGSQSLADVIQAAGNAETSVVSISPPAPCCEKQTLPQFLGITGACEGIVGLTAGIVDRVRNRLGSVYPGLEAKPPVLAITDPANLSEDSPPAVKAAAEVKAQEDAAAQKVKAVRYLATVGCGGCYPDVEDALIAAMEDCTEEVRFEAVLAVRKTVEIECCFCSQASCCSEKVQNKLHELAFDKKYGGEPSARVRRQARIALEQCCPPTVEDDPESEEASEDDIEGPEGGFDEDDDDFEATAEDGEQSSGESPAADGAEPVPAPAADESPGGSGGR